MVVRGQRRVRRQRVHRLNLQDESRLEHGTQDVLLFMFEPLRLAQLVDRYCGAESWLLRRE